MTLLKRVWHSIQSLVAAVVTAGLCFVPAWFAHLAIDAGLAPLWGYGFVGLLVLVGAGAVLSMLEKAFRGRPIFGATR